MTTDQYVAILSGFLSTTVSPRTDGLLDVSWSCVLPECSITLTCSRTTLHTLVQTDFQSLGATLHYVCLAATLKAAFPAEQFPQRPQRKHLKGLLKDAGWHIAQVVYPWVKDHMQQPHARQNPLFGQLVQKVEGAISNAPDAATITAWVVEHFVEIYSRAVGIFPATGLRAHLGLRRPTANIQKFQDEYLYAHSKQRKRLAEFLPSLGFPSAEQSFAVVEQTIAIVLQQA